MFKNNYYQRHYYEDGQEFREEGPPADQVTQYGKYQIDFLNCNKKYSQYSGYVYHDAHDIQAEAMTQSTGSHLDEAEVSLPISRDENSDGKIKRKKGRGNRRSNHLRSSTEEASPNDYKLKYKTEI